VFATHPKVFFLHGQRIRDFKTTKQALEIGHTRPVFVEVRYGKPGCGKSHSVFAPEGMDNCALFDPPLSCFHPKHVFIKRDQTQWFCGYEGQAVLLLDDYYPKDEIHCDQLMAWLDKYVFRIQIKGGSVLAQWQHVIITSNHDPNIWFVDWNSFRHDEPLEFQVARKSLRYNVPEAKRLAVLDRITRQFHFTGDSRRHDAAVEPLPWVPPTDDEIQTSIRAPSVSGEGEETEFANENDYTPAQTLRVSDPDSDDDVL
jgi:hypothetical protein